MYSISKSVSFCYGHRLINYDGKCRHLHGHNSRIEITFERDTLDSRGMVYDYAEIRDSVKAWIDGEIDHTLLLHKDDPLVPLLLGAGERLRVVDWNPTAENIARMIFEHVIQTGYPIAELTLWETDTACARYRRSDASGR